jgi:hypothetical protein
MKIRTLLIVRSRSSRRNVTMPSETTCLAFGAQRNDTFSAYFWDGTGEFVGF